MLAVQLLQLTDLIVTNGTQQLGKTAARSGLDTMCALVSEGAHGQ